MGGNPIMIELEVPIIEQDVRQLQVGDIVFINGIVFTARDLAHQRLSDYLDQGKNLPEDFKGGVIFHAGPIAEKSGKDWIMKGIGPTTSMRMEPFSYLIPKLGVRIIIGKGGMGEETLKMLSKYGGIYLLGAPGCAVKHSSCVKSIERVHWTDLGMPEALWVLRVDSWGPLVVGMDSNGNSLFKDVKEKAQAIFDRMFS